MISKLNVLHITVLFQRSKSSNAFITKNNALNSLKGQKHVLYRLLTLTRLRYNNGSHYEFISKIDSKSYFTCFFVFCQTKLLKEAQLVSFLSLIKVSEIIGTKKEVHLSQLSTRQLNKFDQKELQDKTIEWRRKIRKKSQDDPKTENMITPVQLVIQQDFQ